MATKQSVVNRRGSLEIASAAKIKERLDHLCTSIEPQLTNVDTGKVTSHVVVHMQNGITTRALDDLTARFCATSVTTNPEYDTLAARIVVSDLHKSTLPFFSATTEALNTAGALGKMDPAYLAFVRRHANELDSRVASNVHRDYEYDYFGMRTLIRGYLLRINGEVAETPQYMLMRVAVFLHAANEGVSPEDDAVSLEAVLKAYDVMAERRFTHASPTLFNSGGVKTNALSCFLLGVEDSIEGIYKAIGGCAQISKYAGGIGVHVQNIRGNNSLIRSIGGRSSGIVPMLRVFESTALHVNQAGRRNGSFAIYISPWHPDIFSFLKLKRHQGEEQERAHTLHYGLWVSDLFMRAVQDNAEWHLLCPDDCPAVRDTHGTPAFEIAYRNAVAAGKSRRVVKAQQIWREYLMTQIETGEPYLLFADAANRTSNQQNLGIIRSSNLCAEIIEYSDNKEYACCTLASIALPAHVDIDAGKAALIARGPLVLVRCPEQVVCIAEGILNLHNVPYKMTVHPSAGQSPGILYDGEGNSIGGWQEIDELLRPRVDYMALAATTRQVVRNLDAVIDRNYYPTPETRLSNERHRPLGIGVQGLADVYNLMRHPFDSPAAHAINIRLSATIYYAAMQESIAMAKESGAYPTFAGSPLSHGKFQFDLWGVEPIASAGDLTFDWEQLRTDVKLHGARHSLLTAYMPTASTSQILGNNECFEPRTSNIYRRETSAGSFVVLNKHCVRYLQSLGIWSTTLKDAIIANRGSLKGIHPIPIHVQKIFSTAWDLSMKTLIDQSAERGAYICQSQSLNHYYDGRPTIGRLTSAYFYAWKKGLKTGVYYCHTRPPVEGVQAVTLAPTIRTPVCASCEG